MVSHFFQYKLKYSQLKNNFYKTLAYPVIRCILQNKLLFLQNNSLLFSHLLVYLPVLKVREWDQVFLLYFVQLINSVTLFFSRHMSLQTSKNVQGKELPNPCPAVLCCCWNKPCTYQSRNRKMQISITLNKELCWQLQGTNLDRQNGFLVDIVDITHHVK